MGRDYNMMIGKSIDSASMDGAPMQENRIQTPWTTRRAMIAPP
jgi:hypothetical protein